METLKEGNFTITIGMRGKELGEYPIYRQKAGLDENGFSHRSHIIGCIWKCGGKWHLEDRRKTIGREYGHVIHTCRTLESAKDWVFVNW